MPSKELRSVNSWKNYLKFRAQRRRTGQSTSAHVLQTFQDQFEPSDYGNASMVEVNTDSHLANSRFNDLKLKPVKFKHISRTNVLIKRVSDHRTISLDRLGS